jgi:hypothetical protein
LLPARWVARATRSRETSSGLRGRAGSPSARVWKKVLDQTDPHRLGIGVAPGIRAIGHRLRQKAQQLGLKPHVQQRVREEEKRQLPAGWLERLLASAGRGTLPP